jgi:hypothetical protein
MRSESKFRQLLIFVAAVCFAGFVLASHYSELRKNVSKRDSIQYWSTGQLLLRNQNPYDTVKVTELQRSQGYTASKALVMRIPPWSLFLFLPLGVLNIFWAWAIWVIASLSALLLSIRMCWRLYGDPSRPPGPFLIAAYTFAPVLACLLAGQIGILLLFGFVLFLRLEKEHPYIAGAALILPVTKPHLLVLVWLTLIFWSWGRKQAKILVGFLGMLAFGSAVSLALDPGIFQHHRAMVAQAAIEDEFIPCLSGVLRLVFFPHHFWVQFLPLVIASVWCVWFYLANRDNWEWRYHGLALVVVSVLVAPYSWLTDEVLVLPAVLQGVLWIYRGREQITGKSRLAVTFFAALNFLLVLMVLAEIPLPTGFYFWSSLAWLGWYVYSSSFRTLSDSRVNAVAVNSWP